jgi:hypothetical protein
MTLLVLSSARVSETSAAREKLTIAPPDPRAAEVPDGFQVEVVEDRLMYPSSIEFDDAGCP